MVEEFLRKQLVSLEKRLEKCQKAKQRYQDERNYLLEFCNEHEERRAIFEGWKMRYPFTM